VAVLQDLRDLHQNAFLRGFRERHEKSINLILRLELELAFVDFRAYDAQYSRKFKQGIRHF